MASAFILGDSASQSALNTISRMSFTAVTVNTCHTMDNKVKPPRNIEREIESNGADKHNGRKCGASVLSKLIIKALRSMRGHEAGRSHF